MKTWKKWRKLKTEWHHIEIKKQIVEYKEIVEKINEYLKLNLL